MQNHSWHSVENMATSANSRQATLEAYSPLLGCKRFDLNTNKLAILSPAEKCRRPSDRTSWELVRGVLVSSPPTGCHGLSHAPLDRHLRPERWRRLCEPSGGAAGQWSACQACEMEARPRVNERWTKSGAWEKGGGALMASVEGLLRGETSPSQALGFATGTANCSLPTGERNQKNQDNRIEWNPRFHQTPG